MITQDGANSINCVDFAAFHEEEVEEDLLQGLFPLIFRPQKTAAASSEEQPLDGSKDKKAKTSFRC